MALLPKGEASSLTEKSSQSGPKQFYVGAAWDGDVDLDLVVVPVKDGKAIEDQVVYYNRLKVEGITHSGDALNGDAEGDDESVVIDVSNVDADHVVVGVIAYSVPDMSEAKNTKLAIRDGSSADATSIFELPMSDDDVDGETVLVSCVLSKSGESWTAKNIGAFLTEFKSGIDSLNGMVGVSASYC